MSNRPEGDPIQHAAKFLWIWALLPIIFGMIPFFLPNPNADAAGGWKRFIPFVASAVIALVGLGVWRRMVAATWVGMVVFGAGIAGLVVAAVAGGGEKKGAFLLFGALLVWPIIKLWNAKRAIEAAKSTPPR